MSNAPVNYTIWSGEILPEGLSLSESGLLTGRPTVSGSYQSQIQLRTNWGVATKTINLTIEEPSYGVEITNDNSSAINFYKMKSSSYTFVGSYSVPSSEASQAPVWTISGLPSGISASNLNANNLTISGYPTGTGNSTLKLTLKKGSYSASKNFTLSVTSDGKALTITTSSLPSGTVGVSYSTSLSVSNTTGQTYYNFYANGLPSGLYPYESWTSNPTIKGTPTAAGTSTVSTYVETADGYRSPTKNLSLTIYNPMPSWNTNPITLDISAIRSSTRTQYHPLTSYGQYISYYQYPSIARTTPTYYLGLGSSDNKGNTLYMVTNANNTQTTTLRAPSSGFEIASINYDATNGQIIIYPSTTYAGSTTSVTLYLNVTANGRTAQVRILLSFKK